MKAWLKEKRYRLRDLIINRRNRKRLKNTEFSIICNDCVAGCICKDLHVRMNSPTRNFYFTASDYIKFCENLDHYLACEPRENDDAHSSYLTAKLDDLTMYLVHYSSVEKAREAWTRRAVRVNRENLFFLMNDRNGCTEADIKAFDALPYKNKICVTHIPYPQYSSTVYIKGSETEKEIKDMTRYLCPLMPRRAYDGIDYVSWFNHEL